MLTLLHSERSKLYGVLAILSAKGLTGNPFALRTAKTPQSFGCFECKRVNWSTFDIFRTLQGNDTANSFSVYGHEVDIVASKQISSLKTQSLTDTGSNKVKYDSYRSHCYIQASEKRGVGGEGGHRIKPYFFLYYFSTGMMSCHFLEYAVKLA